MSKVEEARAKFAQRIRDGLKKKAGLSCYLTRDFEDQDTLDQCFSIEVYENGGGVTVTFRYHIAPLLKWAENGSTDLEADIDAKLDRLAEKHSSS